MGYNTAFMIINDGWDQCLKNPEQFVDAINEGIRGGYGRGDSRGVGNHGNVVQLMETAHADIRRVYTSQGNLMLDMSPYSKKTMEFALRDQHGHDYVLGAIDATISELKSLRKTIIEGDQKGLT